jgi:DNA-binding beta-propeller fold protein YncE
LTTNKEQQVRDVKRTNWTVRNVVALAALVLAGVALTAGSASAADVYVRTTSIGSQGSSNGELNLGAHSGVVVNPTTGDIYVGDTGNGRIEEFEPDGTFVRVFGSFTSPTYLAIDETTGDIYVADSGTGTVSKFAADGTPVSAWGTGGKLSGFETLQGIAVGPTGDLFVLESNENSEATGSRFDAGGVAVGAPFATLRERGVPSLGRGLGLGVDPEGNLYAGIGSFQVAKIDDTGAFLGLPDGRNDGRALAVDPSSGDLYVAQENGGSPVVNRYELNCGEECGPLESFGLNEIANPSGIAVTSTGPRYVADAGNSTIAVFTLQTVEPPTVVMGGASGITGTTARLSGEVNPHGFATSCKFEVVSDAKFVEGEFEQATSVPCAPNPGSGSVTAPVEAEAEGLAPATEYHVRLSASNAAGTVVSSEPSPMFTTLAVAPVIDSQEVIGVGLSGATVGGTITPGGAATTYFFEYVEEAVFLAEGFAGPATRSTAAAGPIAGDNAEHAVSATISGLKSNTAYRFRAVAANAVGTVVGAEPAPTFKTQSQSLLPAGPCPANEALRTGPSSLLPDCRAYEQVTPRDKGGLYVEGFPDLVNAADDGSGITFYSGVGSGFPASGGARQDVTTLLSSFSEGSWSTQRLFPPENLGERAGFLGTSANTRFALLEAGDTVEGTSEIEPGLFLLDTETEAVTQIAPYQGAATLGTTFAYDAISNDGSRVFFESRAQLSNEAAAGKASLYVWNRASGEVSLVGVLPSAEGGAGPSGGSFGGAYAWYSLFNTGTGGAFADIYVEAVHAASPSGDQIYFTAGGTGQIYLRRGLTGHSPTTVRVSKGNDGFVDPWTEEIGEEYPAAFQEATPDGSRAFFTSPQKLTEDATTGEEDQGNDLYRYDRSSDRLVDITADLADAENPSGAQVQGLLGVSEDGASGYFAARGNIAPGAQRGQVNIYRFEEDGPESFDFTFVDGAPAEINPCESTFGRNWSPSNYCGPGIQSYVGKESRVTPDGKELVYKNGENLFLYSATIGAPTCISCTSTNSPSVGPAQLTANFFNSNPFTVPQALPAARLTRNLSNDGSRIFFQTPNSLVDADTNGPPSCTYLIDNPVLSPPRQRPSCVDVYEWEAPGAPGGSCTKAEVNGGCLYLLSTGKSDEASYFLDASESGNTAFIATTSQLVPVDQDNLYDVYGVRVGGGIPSQHVLPAAPCVDESCRGSAASASPSSPPGTASFNGEGNVKPKVCRKAAHGKKAQQTCKKPKHKKPKHHKSKKHHKKKKQKHVHGGSSKGSSGKGGKK